MNELKKDTNSNGTRMLTDAELDHVAGGLLDLSAGAAVGAGVSVQTGLLDLEAGLQASLEAGLKI